MDEFDISELDFDKLNILERETYLKALEEVESRKITLESWKQYISHMRESIEVALVDEPEYIYSPHLPFLKRVNPKVLELKARLKNYLIFERYFNSSETAKQTLAMYKKRMGIK